MKNISSFLILILFSEIALCWGKDGHALICQTAARLQAADNKIINSQAFELSYYCNVPDLIWKKPATYDLEKNEHFMDLEIFERAFKKKQMPNPFKLSREQFEEEYPQVEKEAGRAIWRISELNRDINEIISKLKVEKKNKKGLQEKFLILIGVLGHYVGDLSQPLHVTENYDGQLTGQTGIHSYFEEELVARQMPDILVSVHKMSSDQWKNFHKMNEKKEIIDLIEELIKKANANVIKILETDKKIGRKDLQQSIEKHKELINDSLTNGVLYLAEIWSRYLNWKVDLTKFYNFSGAPIFIEPGNIKRHQN